MKIDIFSHIFTKNIVEMLRLKIKEGADLSQGRGDFLTDATLHQIDLRLKVMDRCPDVLQALTMHLPPLEALVAPSDAVKLAIIANDEMAELVAKYPNRFVAAVACLPLNDINAAVKEADRAISRLHFRGVQIFTNINGEPLDAPKFRPLYELMAHHDLPLWIHPWNPPAWGKTPFHDKGVFAWPYQTSLAMVHLVQAGVFEEYPNIKFITHHCGGMVPFFKTRVRDMINGLRKFYADTALRGNAAALMCGYDFFGPEHMLFGTDMLGSRDPDKTVQTIRSVEEMAIPEADKKKIFEDNARRLLKLPV